MIDPETFRQILFDRIVLRQKTFDYFNMNYKMSKSEFNNIKSIARCKDQFPYEFVVKALKLFDSKINTDKEIYKWNLKNKLKPPKDFTFSKYSEIDANGKSIKEKEDIQLFYQDILEIYNAQSKSTLEDELSWIKNNNLINSDENICFYCGISERILRSLYDDADYTCKTKRNRGAWFELDRKDATTGNNIYSKENMVLCCYFCNNHKSDVISSKDMRFYFGKPMFLFLIEKFESLTKSK
jgi:hypothetical protein